MWELKDIVEGSEKKTLYFPVIWLKVLVVLHSNITKSGG